MLMNRNLLNYKELFGWGYQDLLSVHRLLVLPLALENKVLLQCCVTLQLCA